MQNTLTLLDLGFKRYPDWDMQIALNYRAEINGVIFRAFQAPENGTPYVVLGEVSTLDGKVKRWIDCCSDDSVAYQMDQILFNRHSWWLSVI